MPLQHDFGTPARPYRERIANGERGMGKREVPFLPAHPCFPLPIPSRQERASERPLGTVWARLFWDQQEMSLQTATGRSLP